MIPQRLPRQLTLNEVVLACSEEAQQPRDREHGFCFELFRRAIDEQQQDAWIAIGTQYERLLLNWVYASSPAPLAADEAGDMAHDALEKFWRTLTTRSVRVTQRFEHVGALLRYLNQCAVTTCLDHQRRAMRRARLEEHLHAAQLAAPDLPTPEEVALEGVVRAEQVAQVRAWTAQITDPQERRILQLSYVADLSPAEIVAQYPEEFPTVDLVRRIKERVLKRARRTFEAT